MNTWESDYKPGDTVTVIGLGRPAKVRMVRFDSSLATDYFVTWWDESELHEKWLPPDELSTFTPPRPATIPPYYEDHNR